MTINYQQWRRSQITTNDYKWRQPAGW